MESCRCPGKATLLRHCQKCLHLNQIQLFTSGAKQDIRFE
jgi:hypothetical protein